MFSSIFKSRTLILALAISVMIAVFGFSLFTAVFMNCSKTEVLTAKTVRVDSIRTEAQWIQSIRPMTDHLLAAAKARKALTQYPRSEALFNLKAIHEIEDQRFKDAVSTLQRAKKVVVPTTGTMDNNLAWAGLWRGMDRSELRGLYTSSLLFDSTNCNVIHTGLTVEFAIAAEDDESNRALAAVGKYRVLRRNYEGCESRPNNLTAQEFASEILSVGVMDFELTRLQTKTRGPSRLISVGLRNLQRSDRNEKICSNTSPLPYVREQCKEAVKRASTSGLSIDGWNKPSAKKAVRVWNSF